MQDVPLDDRHGQNTSDATPSASDDASCRRLAATQLQGIARFEHCDPLALDDLVDRGLLERYSRDTLICRQGDESNGLMLVVEGVVAIGTLAGAHHVHLVGLLGPGQLHAIVSVVDRRPQELDMAAHEDCILMRFPYALIREGIQRDPRIQEALIHVLAHRMRVIYDKLREAATLSTEQRLVCELGALSRAYGELQQQALVIQLRLTQENLAQLLGTSRREVNGALHSLQAMGLVRVGHQQITIVDPAGLQAQARSTHPRMH